MRRLSLGIAVFLVALCMPGFALATSDPDVDEALKTVQTIDGMTNAEFDKYKGLLEKYADDRQKVFDSMRRVVEANEAEVDGKWDPLCEVGIRAVAELRNSMPRAEKELKKFFNEEKAVWEALMRVRLPQAEEAETKVRKTIEALKPTLEKKTDEILQEDKKTDESDRKNDASRRQTAKEWGIIAGRVVVALGGTAVNAPNEITQPADEMLQSASLIEGAYTDFCVRMRFRIANIKVFTQFRGVSKELQKRLEASIEEMDKEEERARSDLKNFDNLKGLKAATDVWIQLLAMHAKETREMIKSYNDVTKDRVWGRLSDDMKATLGDQRYFNDEFAAMEEESKQIEATLNNLDRAISDYRDGNFKTKMKDNFAKCREILKKCIEMRREMKGLYESALGDAELK